MLQEAKLAWRMASAATKQAGEHPRPDASSENLPWLDEMGHYKLKYKEASELTDRDLLVSFHTRNERDVHDTGVASHITQKHQARQSSQFQI
jgi:hypothetical protein